MNAFEAAALYGREDVLQADLVALMTRLNRSGRNDRTAVDATFLRVTVSVG